MSNLERYLTCIDYMEILNDYNTFSNVLRNKKPSKPNVLPDIKLVDFNEKKGTTTVKWTDNTITQVKVQVDMGDTYNPEVGLAMCIAKKALGNKGNFNEVFKKWLPEEFKG